VSDDIPIIPLSLDETGIMPAINLYDKVNEWGELITTLDTKENKQARAKCQQEICDILETEKIEINRCFCICKDHPHGRTILSVIALTAPIQQQDTKAKWELLKSVIHKGATYPPPTLNNRTLMLEMADRLLIDNNSVIFDMLMSIGADLNEQDSDGNTILHLAVQTVTRRKEKFHIIEFLCTVGIAYGLDPYIQNHQSKQAIDDSLGFGFFRRKDPNTFNKLKEYLVAATQTIRPRYEGLVINLISWRFPKDVSNIIIQYIDYPSAFNPNRTLG